MVTGHKVRCKYFGGIVQSQSSNIHQRGKSHLIHIQLLHIYPPNMHIFHICRNRRNYLTISLRSFTHLVESQSLLHVVTFHRFEKLKYFVQKYILKYAFSTKKRKNDPTQKLSFQKANFTVDIFMLLKTK